LEHLQNKVDKHMNIGTFVGRAGRDAEIKYFESGTQVSRVTIAVDRPKDKENPLWIRCEFWGKTADIAAQYVQKGSLIGVSGEIDLETWEKRDGSGMGAAIVVRSASLRLLGSKQADGDGEDNSNGRSASQPAPAKTPVAASAKPPTPVAAAPETNYDDIPF
jgi:single-strand DNA-binding protein